VKTKRTKRTTEIIIEKDEAVVVRHVRRQVFAWCAKCAAEVRMCTPYEAAATARITTRTVYRWVEAGRVHYTETADGSLLVCLNSLFEKEIQR
jgi:hypothetical protein